MFLLEVIIWLEAHWNGDITTIDIFGINIILIIWALFIVNDDIFWLIDDDDCIDVLVLILVHVLVLILVLVLVLVIISNCCTILYLHMYLKFKKRRWW